MAALGMILTNTCINYQSVLPPVKGEHLAFGDTGSVIYANSVCGARSNYEGGPAALAAALTGRVPRYGFHLDACRQGTQRYRDRPIRRAASTDWGALGALIGRRQASYWEVPVVEAAGGRAPNSDSAQAFRRGDGELGLDRDVPRLRRHARGARMPTGAPPRRRSATPRSTLLRELRAIPRRRSTSWCSPPRSSRSSSCSSSRGCSTAGGSHDGTALLVATSPEIRHGAERMGYIAGDRAGRRHRAGGRLLLPDARPRCWPRPTAGAR